MNEFLELPYNPSIFDMDLRYLEGRQLEDIKAFISKRYKRNKAFIEDLIENTTMDFIRNSANIYKKGVEYTDWEKEKWVKRRVSALVMLEKYREMNKQALFWTYKKNGLWQFKAVHASKYSVIYAENGEMKRVIIRSGQLIKEKEIWHNFIKWEDNQITNIVAKSWDTLPLHSDWQVNQFEPTFKFFPFTIIGSDIALPQKSNIPAYENVITGGMAFGDIAAQRAFLKMIYGSLNISKSKWQEMMQELGMFKYPNIPPSEDGNSGNALNSLDLGDGKVQLEWIEFVTKGLERLAHSMGTNINGLYKELKVESGVSRRLQMENIIDVRNEKISLFEDFENEDQEVLINLGVVSNFSEVIYSELDMGETAADKEDLKTKKQANILNRYTNGTITKVQMTMEIEELTEEEAKARLKEVENERSGQIVEAGGISEEIE